MRGKKFFYKLSSDLSMVLLTFVCVFMQQQKTGVDKRECCLQEIRQTEEKYSDTLESILQVCAHVQSVKTRSMHLHA